MRSLVLILLLGVSSAEALGQRGSMSHDANGSASGFTCAVRATARGQTLTAKSLFAEKAAGWDLRMAPERL